MKKDVIQNELSEERTELSNEQTLLAYIRTSLAAFAFAFFLLRIIKTNQTDHYIGILSLIVGIAFIITGIFQYKKRKRLIRKFRKYNIKF